jgi:hypothetical protein
MLTPDDERTDGGFISYLEEPVKWRKHDPGLFDLLAEVVPSGRSLRHVEERQLLPGSILIDISVPDDRTLRANYFWEILHRLGDAELVFFDPDNGIEVGSCPPGRKDSSKYVAWSELVATYSSGRSVLVYQHFPRRSREAFIAEIASELLARTGAREVSCFRTANVAFFLVSQPGHEERLSKASAKAGTLWEKQIDVSHHTSIAVQSVSV